MATLNYLCEHDVSDEDCKKCGKHGIMLSCPVNCPDFKDARNRMSEEMLRIREAYMKELGQEEDEKPCWKCLFRRKGFCVNLYSNFMGARRENMDTCTEWESDYED